MRKTALTLAALGVLALAGPAFASDHLVDAATSPGADHRGFGNPNNANPSPANPGDEPSSPGNAAGEGNPNSGRAQDTPASPNGREHAGN